MLKRWGVVLGLLMLALMERLHVAATQSQENLGGLRCIFFIRLLALCIVLRFLLSSLGLLCFPPCPLVCCFSLLSCLRICVLLKEPHQPVFDVCIHDLALKVAD